MMMIQQSLPFAREVHDGSKDVGQDGGQDQKVHNEQCQQVGLPEMVVPVWRRSMAVVAVTVEGHVGPEPIPDQNHQYVEHLRRPQGVADQHAEEMMDVDGVDEDVEVVHGERSE